VVRVMVLNITFNNISEILWCILLVEDEDLNVKCYIMPGKGKTSQGIYKRYK